MVGNEWNFKKPSPSSCSRSWDLGQLKVLYLEYLISCHSDWLPHRYSTFYLNQATASNLFEIHYKEHVEPPESPNA